jgi:hypothetical protein
MALTKEVKIAILNGAVTECEQRYYQATCNASVCKAVGDAAGMEQATKIAGDILKKQNEYENLLKEEQAAAPINLGELTPLSDQK